MTWCRTATSSELRNAVRGFVEQYNAQWIVEKNGYLSPGQARPAWHTCDVTQARRHETNLCPRNRVRYTYANAGHNASFLICR